MKKLFLLLLLCAPFNVSAQVCGNDCIEQPSCADLGYKQDITCENGYITCPFDSSYHWCKEYTCEDGRYYASPSDAEDEYCSEAPYHGITCYDCTTCSEGFTAGITSSTDCQAIPLSGCIYFIPDSSNANCGMCYYPEVCDGSYCSKEACEADTGHDCSLVSGSAVDDNVLNDTIVCYSPSVGAVEDCCNELNVTSGTVYFCQNNSTIGNQVYPTKCSYTNTTENGYECNPVSCN